MEVYIGIEGSKQIAKTSFCDNDYEQNFVTTGDSMRSVK